MEHVMTIHIKRALVLAIAALTAACTVTDTPTPPVAGPSELSLSLAISANPDVVSQDGGRSDITIEARDANGQPKANQLLYLEILGGDFGTLSRRDVRTDNQGRATFTYTAPSAQPDGPSSATDVTIVVTPSESDRGNAASRFVNITLVPSGTIDTGAPTPAFAFTPETPAAFETVRFDGSASTASRGATIVSYTWEFGDGDTSTSSSSSATHLYRAPGSYAAKLKVTDSQGISATSPAQIVLVGAGVAPVASFVFSPLGPTVNETVFFNAATSVAGTGHRIVRYRWNFGDGTPSGSGSTVSHKFTEADDYIVVLVVEDEVGQTSTTTRTVTID